MASPLPQPQEGDHASSPAPILTDEQLWERLDQLEREEEEEEEVGGAWREMGGQEVRGARREMGGQEVRGARREGRRQEAGRGPLREDDRERVKVQQSSGVSGVSSDVTGGRRARESGTLRITVRHSPSTGETPCSEVSSTHPALR